MDRRETIAALGATALLASATGPARAMGEPPKGECTFVLVHGAWHGGWCWRLVADKLRAAGHKVFTPTLTGMGERHHLARPETSLNTHIQDVLAVIDMEELSDVILVAHSYAGAVAQGVADGAHEQLKHVVMLDASVVDDGEAMMSGAPPEMVAAAKAQLIDDFLLPSWPTEAFGVLPEDGWVHAWVTRRLTSMPWRSLSTPLALKNGGLENCQVTFIDCNGRPFGDNTKASLAKAKAKGWAIEELATGHDAMVTAPDALADMLIRLA